MPAPKRKPAAETAAPAPQFRVLPKPTPAATPPPATGGVKKRVLGAVVATAADKKTEHPYLVAPGEELMETLMLFAEKSPEFKALEGTVKGLSKSAGLLGKPFWFQHWHRRGCADSTMLVKRPGGGKDIRLVFKNAYSRLVKDDAPLVALLGDRTGEHFYEATELKLTIDAMPEHLQDPFIDGVIALAAELGIASGIEAKQYIKPKPGVHEQRHTLFTPEENMAIDEILPITAYPQV